MLGGHGKQTLEPFGGLNQAADDSEDVLEVSWLSSLIAQRYLKRDCALHVHFRDRLVEGKLKDGQKDCFRELTEAGSPRASVPHGERVPSR